MIPVFFFFLFFFIDYFAFTQQSYPSISWLIHQTNFDPNYSSVIINDILLTTHLNINIACKNTCSVYDMFETKKKRQREKFLNFIFSNQSIMLVIYLKKKFDNWILNWLMCFIIIFLPHWYDHLIESKKKTTSNQSINHSILSFRIIVLISCPSAYPTTTINNQSIFSSEKNIIIVFV